MMTAVKSEPTIKVTPVSGIFAVVASAFMCGFVWSFRGSYAFADFISLFCFCLCVTLIIFSFFGNKRKMNYEAIPAAAGFGLLTYGSVNTFASQLSGTVSATDTLPGRNAVLPVAPFSGLIISLLAGFGMLALFWLFIASLFSKRKYKLTDYLITVLIFFAAAVIFKMSVAHVAVKIFCPDAADYFAQSLSQKEISQSPMTFYLHNFFDAGRFYDIPYGKNYFMSVQAVSYSAAALVTAVSALLIFKDKITAFLSLGFDLVCAVSLALSGFIASLRTHGGFIGKVLIPSRFPVNETTFVHLMTGFFIGFFVMLILVCLPKRITGGEGRFRYEPVFSSPYACFAFDSVFCFTVPLTVTVCRPFGNAAAQRLVGNGLASSERFSNVSYLVCALTAIALFAVFAPVIEKNIISKGIPAPLAMRTERFSEKALPVLTAAYFAVYLFAGYGNFRKIAEIIKAPRMIFSTGSSDKFSLAAVCLSALMFFVFYFAASACKKSKRK